MLSLHRRRSQSGSSGGTGATDISMTAVGFNEATGWAGKQIASFTASPAGIYDYSLTDDAGGKVIISRRGNLRLAKNPSPGASLTYTVRVVPWGGGAAFTKTFTQTVGSYNYLDDIHEWWSADDVSKLYQESTKVTPVSADGQPVGSWAGKVKGWEWARTGTTGRPTYKTNVIGSLSSVRFSGAQYLDGVTAALTGYMAGVTKNFTVFFLGRTNAESQGTWIGWGSTGTALDPRVYVATLPSITPAVAGQHIVVASFADDTTTAAIGTPTVSTGTIASNQPAFFSVSRGNDVAATITNGSPNRYQDITRKNTTQSVSARLGQRTAGGAPNNLNGDICDIILVNREMTQMEQIVFMRQFMAMRGNPVTIPAEPAELDMSGLSLVYSEDFDGATDNVLDYLNPSYARDRIEPTKIIPSFITSRTVDGSPGATSGETGWMADPRPGSAFVNDPTMYVANDKLVMNPKATPTPLLANASNKPYLAAALQTKGLVDLEEGAYFEVNIQYPTMLPGYRGSFPAPIWLLHSHGAWMSSEVDGAEMFGSRNGDTAGNSRNALSVNDHSNPYWPIVTATNTPAPSDTSQGYTQTVPHDLSADQHLIGVRIVSDGYEVYLDRKLRAKGSLLQKGVYGATINNAGDGTIPGTSLTVVVKGGVSDAKLVFSVSGGILTGLTSVSNSGSGFQSAGAATFFRSDGTTPLGYGISLTALVGNETIRNPMYNNPMYALINFAISGSGIDGGTVDASGFPRPMPIDWIKIYDKVIPTPSIGAAQDSATTTLLSKWSSVGYTPTAPQIGAVDSFIKYLKAYGLREDTEGTTASPIDWDPATQFYMWDRLAWVSNFYKIPVAAARLVNWRNPGGVDLLVNGSPIFDPSFGVQFTGTAGEFLETSHGLGGSALIDPWDSHMGVYVHEGPTDTAWKHIIGANSGSPGYYGSLGNSEVGTSTSNTNYNLYSAPTISHGIKPISSGHVVWARGWRPASFMYKDGKFWTGGYTIGSQLTKPSKFAGSTMKIGAVNPGIAGAACKIRAAHFGGKFTMRESKIMKDLLEGMWTYF